MSTILQKISVGASKIYTWRREVLEDVNIFYFDNILLNKVAGFVYKRVILEFFLKRVFTKTWWQKRGLPQEILVVLENVIILLWCWTCLVPVYKNIIILFCKTSFVAQTKTDEILGYNLYFFLFPFGFFIFM